jgi:hypothetical protein
MTQRNFYIYNFFLANFAIGFALGGILRGLILRERGECEAGQHSERGDWFEHGGPRCDGVGQRRRKAGSSPALCADSE